MRALATVAKSMPLATPGPLRGQLPVEADAIVVSVDRPGAMKTVAGEALLHRPHHAIDLGVSFAQ